MKRIVLLLIGISVFYFVPATSAQVGDVETTNNETHSGTHLNPANTNSGTTNTNPNIINTNPDTTINTNTSNQDGLGSAGNTTGIGTDHSGGNGPSN